MLNKRSETVAIHTRINKAAKSYITRQARKDDVAENEVINRILMRAARTKKTVRK